MHRGTLDFRQTVRHSLSYGGVPAEPKFKRPRPSKPEIMVVADISGSVASFARFTLQFVYAMQSEFSKVRSWVFIDGIDEVTRFFDEADDVANAIQRVNTEADVVWVDGHSDYGHAFEVWHDRHIREVTRKSSIILLGDARNNYHASQAWTVDEMRKRARRVFWLDPEPRGYWDTGDSIVSEYAPTATACTRSATSASSRSSSKTSSASIPRDCGPRDVSLGRGGGSRSAGSRRPRSSGSGRSGGAVVGDVRLPSASRGCTGRPSVSQRSSTGASTAVPAPVRWNRGSVPRIPR